MHVDVVLSVFIPPCTNKRRRAQYSRGVDAAVCVRALQVCVQASDVCVHRKLLAQCLTVTQTIPSVFYALLVPSGSAYIES